MTDSNGNETGNTRHPMSAVLPADSALDLALTSQIVVAYAGETADESRRLGWWRSDLMSEYGGKDLFRRLLPKTWEWAVLQAVREAARRADRAARSGHHDPDSIRSLFHQGFEIDERLDERLSDLQRSDLSPVEALPDLSFLDEPWDRGRFEAWVETHGEARTVVEPIGRRVREPSNDRESSFRQLIAALLPLGDSYPLPYFVAART